MATSETDLNRSATGQAAAVNSVADACPLSQADEDVLIQGFRRSQQITAAGRMAFVNFLVSAVFASFGLLSIVSSLLNSALSIPAVVITIGLATVAVIILVFMLSQQLRRGEFHTLSRIGASRTYIGLLVVSELVFVFVGSLLLAALLTLGMKQYALQILHNFLTI